MNKIKIGLLIIVISVLVSYSKVLAADVLDPNYGTTTFFSEKSEMPSSNPPIYDVGVRSVVKVSSERDDVDEDSTEKSSLFNQIVGGVGDFFGVSNSLSVSTSNSLFEWQQDSDTFSDSSDSSGRDVEFIMGARGESLENIDDEQAAKYKSNMYASFNFKANNSAASPKKSKLLFTNIIVPVDMTTQYILIGLVFLCMIGLTVGYYFWKKEIAKSVSEYKEEQYD